MEIDGQLVLVLEYLNGRTLREELAKRGSLPWHEAIEHVVRVADALAVAHEQSPPIVHRDLKPENVMLTAFEGQPEGAPTGLKVMDFGIAKVLEGMHGTNTHNIGTLQYMSPEQIDARTIDARSDLYALGLLFYEMLPGEPPFNSPSPRELLNLQCTAPPPARSGTTFAAGFLAGWKRCSSRCSRRRPRTGPSLHVRSARHSIADVKLVYRDLQKKSDGACGGSLALVVRADGTGQKELDPFVAARVERSRTASTLTEANQLFETGRIAEARAKLATCKDELRKRAATVAPNAPGSRDGKASVRTNQEAASSSLAKGRACFCTTEPCSAP